MDTSCLCARRFFLIPVCVDVVFNSRLRARMCAWVCMCLKPTNSLLSSNSPIELNVCEKIHPLGLWNEFGSLQLEHLISPCCSAIFVSYFRCPLLVVGSWVGPRQPWPSFCPHVGTLWAKATNFCLIQVCSVHLENSRKLLNLDKYEAQECNSCSYFN